MSTVTEALQTTAISGGTRASYSDMNFNSEYRELYPIGPNGTVDLKPGTDTHDALLEEILIRARDSESFISPKHPTWRKIDEMNNVFIPQDGREQAVTENDERIPTSVVVSESYAQLQTFVTYMMAVFSQSPMFTYEPTGPEDELGAILLEKVIDIQMQRSKALLALHTHWKDCYSYGIGPIAVAWVTKAGFRIQNTPQGYTDPFTGEFVQTGTSREPVEAVLYEGNEFSAIDPYKYLPDPAVPVDQPQSGEYVGWMGHTTYMSMLRREQEPGSPYFNTRYIRNNRVRSTIFASDSSGRDYVVTQNAGEEPDRSQKVDEIFMYIDLIPKEWGLGTSENPEKWMFAVAADSVITAAFPMGLFHNMFPVACGAPDTDGHGVIPISRLEILYPLQKNMNFLYNAHIRAVVQSLRMRLIVDPKGVNLRDVLQNKDVIRTTKRNWNRGVGDFVTQLKVTDITRNNMADLEQTRALARNITGAVDSLQGLQRTGGERVTAEEFSSTKNSAMSRLQKDAQLLSLQVMQDLGYLCAFQTQQLMTEETYVSTIGRWQEKLTAIYGQDARIPVTPYDLNVNFDVIVKDGSMEPSGGENFWLPLIQMISQNEELSQQMDIPRMIANIAQQQGIKNFEQFVRKQPQVEVRPDAEVQQQVADNQLRPVNA